MKISTDKNMAIGFAILFMIIDVALVTFIVWQITGNRNTFCDGVRVRQEIRELHHLKPLKTPTECISNNTKLNRLDQDSGKI